MPLFNIIRLSVFCAVMAWTLIVLGLAAFFEHLIIASQYTRFIPLAIFVATVTLIAIPAMLLFGTFKRVLLISQTRVELGLIGLLGVFWFALGIYTTTEESADVECDFDGDGVYQESSDYSSDTFHSQYRVLQAFSLFNSILLIGYLLFLLFLTMRQHSQGRRFVWISGTTSFPWFGGDAQPPLPDKSMSLPTAHVTVQALPGKQQKSETGAPMRAGGHYLIYIPAPPPRVV